jgi:hypothetical protein
MSTASPLFKSLVTASRQRVTAGIVTGREFEPIKPATHAEPEVIVEKAADPPQAPDGHYVEPGGKVTATLEDGSSITGEVKSVSADSVKIVAGGKNFTVKLTEITSVVAGPEGTEPKTQLPLKPSDMSSEQKSQVKLLSKIWPDDSPQLEGTPDSVTVKFTNGTSFTVAGDGTVTVGAPDAVPTDTPPPASEAATNAASSSASGEDVTTWTDEEILAEIAALETEGATDDPLYAELQAEAQSRGIG